MSNRYSIVLLLSNARALVPRSRQRRSILRRFDSGREKSVPITPRTGIGLFLNPARRCHSDNYRLASALPRTILSEISVETLGKGTDMSGTGANEAQNIAVVRRGYEAFAKGDIET